MVTIVMMKAKNQITIFTTHGGIWFFQSMSLLDGCIPAWLDVCAFVSPWHFVLNKHKDLKKVLKQMYQLQIRNKVLPSVLKPDYQFTTTSWTG